MIHEIVVLPVKPEQVVAFEHAFGEVAYLLVRAKGYEGHLLTQGIEKPSDFTLIVRWQSLEDHTQGFEPSDDHQGFIAGLQEYLAAEPIVSHVRTVVPAAGRDILAA